MLDNPYQTACLLSKLEDALPLPAFATPELQAAFRQQGTGAEVTSDIRVTEVHYLGDPGGITCRLAFDTDAEVGTFIVSITHLRFDRRHKLSREIANYQKHRVKRLRYE
jgi:hypothetical protein